jgi:poly(3-hydroxybutyrate) depolymerase
MTWRKTVATGWIAGLLALLAGLGVSSGLSAASEPLPALGIELDATSVSGLSAGAYMAEQIELTHASHLVGAGIVAGGPFACAESASGRAHVLWNELGSWENEVQSGTSCTQISAGVPDPKTLADRAKELAEAGEIDPVASLAAHKVYLFTGAKDEIVLSPVVEAAASFYKALGVPDANVHLEHSPVAGHSFITKTKGKDCGTSEKPYVSHCGYNQARAILEWIYGRPLVDPGPEPTGSFIVFDQSVFDKSPPDGLAEDGVVYVPAACAGTNSGCRLHVVLHGCQQSRDAVGEDFIKESGFAELADKNKLVILFPQTGIAATNGCFDWWGYTGLDFMGREAPQIAAIWAMVERLAAQP